MSAKSAIEARLRVIGKPCDVSSDPTESYIAKWDKSLKKFSYDIEQYYYENRQDPDEFKKKLNILKEVEDYLAENVFNETINGARYELKAVVPFGSSASGLGMTGGDLDMIVCVYPALKTKSKRILQGKSNDILAEIFKRIESRKLWGNRKVKDMEHIDGARVPIITGTVDDVEVDISISMTKTVSAQYLASKFIDAYSRYDRRFILLAAFVKAWQKSKKTDQNEDYYRTVFPNSCSTVLLVIFFMKYYKLLPHVNAKHNDILGEAYATWARVNQGENGSFGVPRKDVSNWQTSNTCDISVGTLFLLFLDFYTNVVDFKHQKLVIEHGSLAPKTKKERRYRIVINDVVDKDNTAQSVTEAGMYAKWLEDAQNIVMKTEDFATFEKLMEDKLRDIKTYSMQEIMQLKKKGLHVH